MKWSWLNAVALAASMVGSSNAIAAADPALLTARQKFFGIENVDATTAAVKKDKVVFSWTTNASWAVSILGRVVLLDTYVNRAEIVPGRTPFIVQDLVDLRPEAIFLGHGHSDHADNAAWIAKKLNIPVYTSAEECDTLQADTERYFGVGNRIVCVAVVSRGSTPGDEIVRIPQLEPLACIVAFKHLHSVTVPYDPTYPFVPINNIADPRDADLYPVGTAQSYGTTNSLGPGGPIALFYQFVLRGGYNFTFDWHDSSGALPEGIGADRVWGPAVGARLSNILESLAPTDVEIGAIVSLGISTNGQRDTVLYTQHIKPKVFIPTHLDVLALPSSSPEWRAAWFRQAAVQGLTGDALPDVRWLSDPLDYAKPLVYTPGDPRWSNTAKAARVANQCN